MPIAPIQQYQDPSNSLMQILQGGNQHIGSILDRAIQIGRDIANKRTQQEQDLAAMRNQETAMAQRRGENLQSVLETQQKFGMEQDKFAFLKMDTQRKYDANRIDEGVRAMEKDATLQEQKRQFDQSYGLSQRRVAVDEATAKRQADAVAAEQQRLEAAATPPTQAAIGPANPASAAPFEIAGPVNVLAAPNTTGKTFVSPLGRAMTASGARPFVNAAEGGSTAPTMDKLLAVPSNVGGGAAPAVDAGSLKLDIRDAEKGLMAAEKLGDRAKIEGWKSQLKGLYTKEASLTKADTPAEQRAAARFAAWEEDRLKGGPQGSSAAPIKNAAAASSEVAKQIVEGTPEAFQNPYEFAPQGKTEAVAEKTSRETLGKRWASDSVSGEKQSALSLEKPDYIARFSINGLSPEQIKRARDARGKLWDAAREEAAANARLRGQGSDAAPESAVDRLKRQY